LLIWLAIGMMIYFLYGSTRSRVQTAATKS